MNRRTFFKSLFGLGAAAAVGVPLLTKAKQPSAWGQDFPVGQESDYSRWYYKGWEQPGKWEVIAT